MSITMKRSMWLGGLALLAALGVAVKMALAIAAFSPADQPVGYVSQDEMTNYDLRSGNEALFRTQYEREFWSGSLFYYPVDARGNIGFSQWHGDEIDGQNPDTGRFIGTMKDDGTGAAFRLASLSAAQMTLLNNDTALVNFLRGDRTGEGTTYRKRLTVMGDIVHSRPLYVADATNPTLFVGANDGMLHAIKATADGGTERWAYVPSMLLPKMKNLAVTPYVHDYYVDGQVNVATVDDGDVRMLVGGLGSGGKGLYALNITGSAGLSASSDTEVAAKVMWEITPTKLSYAAPATVNAYVNLGYTYGTISMAKMKISGAMVDVVIFGNGYNDGLGSYAGCTHGTPNYANCGGNYAAYLYVVNALTGQLISAIKAGANGTAAAPNGLSTPVAIDVDGDGAVDRVYAGDLNGTMWKFDLAAATSSALMVTSPLQAITGTPGVGEHPNGGFMVTFATGKMLVAADATDNSVHFAYGAWDPATPVANAAIQTQTLTERSFTSGSVTTRVRNVTANEMVWTNNIASHKGWKVALPAGERVLGEGSFVENGRFYFTAHNPTLSNLVPGTTTTVKGENWLMELDYLSGGAKNQPFLDLSGDIILNDSDRIKYIATDADVITTPAKLGTPIPTVAGISVGKFISIGVLSQPVLVQLLSLNDTLFNQSPDITIVSVIPSGQGVDGGHFDQDFYYGTGGAAIKASGSVSFTYAASNVARNVTALSIVANGETIYSGAPGGMQPRRLDDFLNGKSSANYVISGNFGDSVTIKIEAKTGGAAFNGTVAVSITTTGGSAPGFTKTNLANGADAAAGDNCLTCTSKKHVHQYDDKFGVTGVNFLNPSDVTQKLSIAIPSITTQFKVLAQNQYLSPAVKLHIGNKGYLFDVDAGYIKLKDYTTSATLDLATLPSYVLDPASALYVGSLAINMPVSALSARDWWGNGDVRVGLHPTKTGCVKSSRDSIDGNMYQPVIPPAKGVDGPGVTGVKAAPNNTPDKSTGVRHMGALTIQIIAAATPNSAIELSVPGEPEYGWRVKSSEFAKYVLAEYTTFWHHPNGLCYLDAGWTKTPGPDTGTTSGSTTPPGTTDPKIGNLGGGSGDAVSIVTTVVGNVTTTVITYANNLKATIVRTANNDGSVTIVTTAAGAATSTTEIVANVAGGVRSGGDERGLQAKTGRVSWRELVAP